MLNRYTWAAAVTPPHSRRRWADGAPPPAKRMAAGRCSAAGTSYKEKFAVRSYDVGSTGAASILTIARLLQEAGCNHVHDIGFSMDGFATTMTMRKLHLIWVMSRLYIEMYTYPAWRDVIEIETWCQEEGRIGTRRDWILTDMANGLVIGGAISKFVMMNQDTRKLERVSNEVREELLPLRAGPSRFTFPEKTSNGLKKIPRLQFPAQHLRLGLEARRADLDMNQHVNHVTHIGWALESIPQEIIDTHQLHRITLDYKQECYYNDVVDSLTSEELAGKQEEQMQCQFLHCLRLSDSGVEITRCRSEWRKLVQ